MNNKTILDVCCGSRMFYFDKHNKNTIYMDCRELDETLCDGRNLVIAPDVVGDFRSIPFPDETFNLVIFDPPHLMNVGDASWLAKKYGKLDKNWKDDIRTGFNEYCENAEIVLVERSWGKELWDWDYSWICNECTRHNPEAMHDLWRANEYEE